MVGSIVIFYADYHRIFFQGIRLLLQRQKFYRGIYLHRSVTYLVDKKPYHVVGLQFRQRMLFLVVQVGKDYLVCLIGLALANAYL